MWRGQRLRSRVRPLVEGLREQLLLPDWIQSAIQENPSLSPEMREIAEVLAANQEPTSAIQLNRRAWAVVDLDGEGEGDLSLALAWAEAAVEAAPDKERNRKTLAWALFANGRYEEAEVEMEASIERISSSIRRRRQGKELDRLRAMIAEVRSEKDG